MNAMNTNPPASELHPVDGRLMQRIQDQVRDAVPTMPHSIDAGLMHLDREWDIDRVYQATIGVLSGLGLALFALAGPWWLLLPALGAVSLLLRSLFGWSLVFVLLRTLGIRTATEIAYERYALKALRGDFRQVSSVITADDREAISTFEGEGGMAYGPATLEASDPQVVREVLEAVQK